MFFAPFNNGVFINIFIILDCGCIKITESTNEFTINIISNIDLGQHLKFKIPRISKIGKFRKLTNLPLYELNLVEHVIDAFFNSLEDKKHQKFIIQLTFKNMLLCTVKCPFSGPLGGGGG